nr:OPT/YSL family transporter [Planctomycetota bacterium]
MADGFRPHVSPQENYPELSVRAVVIGALLGTLFAAANAYVGLKVGLTVSASIPVAVVFLAGLRQLKSGNKNLGKKNFPTGGAGGGRLGGGIFFPLPAWCFLGYGTNFFQPFFSPPLRG